MSGAVPAGESLNAAASINDLRTQSLLGIGRRLGNLDLSAILIYTIANAPDSALPFLAWQFDILAPWWEVFTNGATQRQLIQQAIALHRFEGTPFAIRSIIANLGFSFSTIEEGQASWGGTTWPSDEGWAAFRVLISKALITPAPNPPDAWDAASNIDLLINIDLLEQAATIAGLAVSAPQQSRLVNAVSFFKPTRCWLDSLWFQEIPQTEKLGRVADAFTLRAGANIIEPILQVSDNTRVPAGAFSDRKVIVPFYGTHFVHAGITHGADEPAVADSGIVIGGQPTE